MSSKGVGKPLNLLTKIRFNYYSDDMISDFHHLSEKVSELAELSRSLRRENAELRAAMAELSTENGNISQRMQEAHRRISGLLEQMPASQPDREVA